MRYDGKRWIDDIEGVSARASAKALSDALVRYAVNVDTEGKYLKAVAALCNIRNRNNMLQDSKDVYFFSNEQLDVNDYLLNLQNGTLDLSGDKPVFLSHSPDMLLSKICSAEYNPAADCREWKKFLLKIMQGDKDAVDSGATTLEAVQEKTGAGTVCGACLEDVKRLVEQFVSEK